MGGNGTLRSTLQAFSHFSRSGESELPETTRSALGRSSIQASLRLRKACGLAWYDDLLSGMRRIALLFCLCAPVLLRAETRWTYAAADHFEVYTTSGERGARDALMYFERVQAFFADFMKMSPKLANRTRLVIFSNDREYKPYRPNEVATAFYQPGPDRDYIVMKTLDHDSYPIVVHEYTHLAIHQSGDRFPPWLNEGLAEFFSTLEPAPGGRMSVGRVPMGRLMHLNDGPVELIRVTRLLAIDHEAPEYNKSAHAGTFYSESWALVHMLMTDPRYRPKVLAFLARMEADDDGLAAFESVYGKNATAVETDLWGYIRKQAYGYFNVTYKEPKTTEKAPVRIAEGFEAGLVTANLLAVSRTREADARAAFDTLAKQKPDDIQLLESRGYFELRRGHREDALAPMSRAVELGSTNATLYRDYAMMGGVDDTRRESLLAKAVLLAPEDVESRMFLASAQMRQGKNADALVTLKPITRVRPDDAYQLFRLLTAAHANERHWAEASAAAGMAVKHARTPVQTSEAQNLLRSLEQVVAASTALTAVTPSSQTSNATATATPASAPQQMSEVDGIYRPVQSPTSTETGRLKNMVCGSGPPVLEVSTAKGLLRLVIDDPVAVRVLGTANGNVDMHCGPQDVPIRVGYIPKIDDTRKTVGNIRLLDFTAK